MCCKHRDKVIIPVPSDQLHTHTDSQHTHSFIHTYINIQASHTDRDTATAIATHTYEVNMPASAMPRAFAFICFCFAYSVLCGIFVLFVARPLAASAFFVSSSSCFWQWFKNVLLAIFVALLLNVDSPRPILA